jgi:hypothetical protein
MSASNNFELNYIVAKHISQASSQCLINPFFDMTGQPLLNPPSYFYQDLGYSDTSTIDWMSNFTVSTETAVHTPFQMCHIGDELIWSIFCRDPRQIPGQLTIIPILTLGIRKVLGIHKVLSLLT